MVFSVWNFGRTRQVLFKGKPIFLQKGFCFTTKDTMLVSELRKYPYIEVKPEKEPKDK